MPNTHALLSPSASHRWLNCTASPLLEAGIPNRDTDYTKEGTLAHAYCAKSLKAMLGQPTDGEDEEIKDLNAYLTGEMLDHVETYSAIVGDKLSQAAMKVKDSQLIVEQKLSFERWIPESFGTADAIIITDGVMEVIDFKYGKGVEVSATWNPQMMIYALGAIAQYEDEYNINKVRMTIVQPRLSNLSEFDISVEGLMWWAHTILEPKAKEAMGGKGSQCSGEWCKFCRAKTQCAKIAADCLGSFDEFGGKNTIDADDMAEKVLPKLATIKAWVGAMEEKALEDALNGVKFPGYKIVEGRSIRKVSDPGELGKRLLEKGFSSDKVFKPMELETITALEKLVGKKDFAAISDGLIIKPQGKPTLVPDSDKREPLNSADVDFKDF